MQPGAVGFGDGALSSDSESLEGKLLDGGVQGTVESATTLVGGVAGNAVGGNIVKSQVGGEAATLIAGIGVAQGINGAQQLPDKAGEALDAARSGIGQMQEAIEKRIGQPSYGDNDILEDEF